MEYNINGSKIKVIRKEDDKGISILDGIIHSYIVTKNKPKEMKKDESNKGQK